MQKLQIMATTRSFDPPEFVRIYREEDKEFRQYSGYLVASTKEGGAYKNATKIAYGRLLDYVQGANTSGVKIPFESPVLQQKYKDAWLVSVKLPAEYDLRSAPIPTDERVVVRKIAPQKVAVIEYDNLNTAENIKEKELELLRWLGRQQDFAPISHGRVAQYDSPYGLPFFRHNEIQIDVRIV
jgi:hypothetical protein